MSDERPPRRSADGSASGPAADGPPAGGASAVWQGLGRAVGAMGALRGWRALASLNQVNGFDCPGCAWPDPSPRASAEFCENGAKHVAHEATRRRLSRDFFEHYDLATLRARSDRWLEAQGRLVEPLYKAAGAGHYRPLSWDEAFAVAGRALRDLPSPDRAVFYTSGRASNEAAFLYQLLARELGTNNLPDCSNLCHESSGRALQDAVGVGKSTVSLADFEHCDLILVLGQNPGTNHPRMLATLQQAARRGCGIVSVNPLVERGLVRFAHPKEPASWLSGGTALADSFVRVRVGGDVALLQGVQKAVLELEAERPGRVLDRDFVRERTQGFAALRTRREATPWGELEAGSGVSRERMRALAERFAGARRVIACWAMGLTQHAHGVANVQEVVNLMLLRGQVGRPGAGLCPVRGHSNVQGDRTMGITERPPPAFLDALERELGVAPPRAPGLDTVGAIEAMAEGGVDVFVSLGGNFAVATPDAETTHGALRRCALSVHVATTLNRSHLVTGREALVLPCLARSERDVQAAGPQFVTVENSVCSVHRSQGTLSPASPELRSEPAIVAGLARAALGERSRLPWEAWSADYDRIREAIARVVPGFEDMNARVRAPGGFVLESGARRQRFDTPDGRARFRLHELPDLRLGPGRLRLMTLRSHDQFNTTVYGDDDRYRGVRGDRRVVFLHAEDVRELGLRAGQRVELTSHYRGETRSVPGFRVVPYDIPRRCAAAYFPEANPLVPLALRDETSRTPAYKSVEISLRDAGT